ncbi:MAG TPA: hypothetical protein V6C90_09090 [Coleofasciculaceae cyanobacterium]
MAWLKSTTTRELIEAIALDSTGVAGEAGLTLGCVILGLGVVFSGAGSGRAAENNSTADPKQISINLVLNERFMPIKNLRAVWKPILTKAPASRGGVDNVVRVAI